MDKTITRRPTYSAFLMHVALRRAPWRLLFLPISAVFGLGYLLRMVSRDRLKELNQLLFLGGVASTRQLEPHIESYADKVMARNIQPGALRQIAADKAEGCQLVMATASYALYAAPIARRLGFDVVLGTRLIGEDSAHVRARIDGENCYGEAKLMRINDWIENASEANDTIAVARTYSDHVSDVPMLLLGSEPVAVNPHPPLADHARAHGWRIADWRQ
ncbi:HAD family hydrolase [Alterisphingorhabdus coralli]|uniref:HAD-IB family phosphatase n=1 Tax=Alterisphingorhabdus coralli TaxID=3071408 RepID=A0AA97F8C7_9SPHN|nr:HAD-IB family phosphatase [Parasphingorhabdus sp. SCSIO 66989]WOE75158.1 HAD-IB family phosphatase [Parasphingorhabdus sp. SCSIO 66989]